MLSFDQCKNTGPLRNTLYFERADGLKKQNKKMQHLRTPVLKMACATCCFFTVWLHENEALCEITQLLRTSGNSRVAVIQLGKAAINPRRVFGFSCANTCCSEDGLGLAGTRCAITASLTFCIHRFGLNNWPIMLYQRNRHA